MSSPAPQTSAGNANDRILRGRELRKKLSRADHGSARFEDRKFDPTEFLLAADEGRRKDLLPLKYRRMGQDPFAFFRGSVHLMAADFGRLPHTTIEVQLCGDAHVQNLGSFAAQDGRIVFDFNDFDETVRGPWEWDVKRMATSIVLAGRVSSQKRSVWRCAAEGFIAQYCATMTSFAEEPIIQVARHQVHRGGVASPISAALHQSRRATPLQLLEKLTEPDPRHGRHFREKEGELWRVTGAEKKEVLGSLVSYRETLRSESLHLFDLFRPIEDVGFKVVGTGSVGLRDYIVLLEGNGPNDPLFLQIKQELPSAYSKHLRAAAYANEGRRVVEGQRGFQTQSDLLLGWTSFDGSDFLVRQLNDHKGQIDIATLGGTGLESLGHVAGELLARGHARSGDACTIHGYCGSGAKIVKSILEFAVAYADQTEKDFNAFKSTVNKSPAPKHS